MLTAVVVGKAEAESPQPKLVELLLHFLLTGTQPAAPVGLITVRHKYECPGLVDICPTRPRYGPGAPLGA